MQKQKLIVEKAWQAEKVIVTGRERKSVLTLMAMKKWPCYVLNKLDEGELEINGSLYWVSKGDKRITIAVERYSNESLSAIRHILEALSDSADYDIDRECDVFKVKKGDVLIVMAYDDTHQKGIVMIKGLGPIYYYMFVSTPFGDSRARGGAVSL